MSGSGYSTGSSPASPVGHVVQLLAAASSVDAAVRVPAHERLQELESKPGFVQLLLEAYADPSVEPQGRLLSVLMCKNVIDRQWNNRSGSGAAIAQEEKLAIKSILLRLVKAATDGGLPHLAELTQVLRRVCRFEFPKQWDGLAHFMLAELTDLRQRGFSDTALAVVLVLHQILKEQSSKRLLSARRESHQLGALLVEPLGGVWALKLEHMKQLQRQGPQSLADDRLWRLSRHLDGSFLLLLVQGFAHLHEHPTGPQMIQLVKEQVELLLALLRGSSELLIQCPFFLKNLKSVLKWWALLFHAHPLAYARANVCSVLHTSVEVLQTLTGLQVAHELRPWLESLQRSSLLLIAHGFNAVALRKGPQPAHQGIALEAATACHSQFSDFTRGHKIGDLCELACHAALRLPAEEVQEWLLDPEAEILGPQSQTDLHQAGENCIRAFGQAPLDRLLVEHLAQRMQEELSQAPVLTDSFETVSRKDTFLWLLALCQAQLKPHLQFQTMLPLFAQIAALVPQMGHQSLCILLPVRLCSVIRAWVAEIPQDAVMPILQLLQSFLRGDGSPKAVRLAALSPLRAMLDRFSDSEAWAQVQGSLIDSCLAVLSIVKTPEVQWRCLNLIHLFLVEEAESGCYAVTEHTLEQLLVLWRAPEESELLVRHALLDVLRALVLMSCRSRSPRLPLSPPLLSCCLTVISDCYAQHRGPSVAASGPESMAALQADAGAAAGALGDQGSATATLFDSGSMLFLGVLRTVELDQAAPLMPFFPKLLAQQTSLGGPPPEWTLDILLEYCALHCSGGAASHLVQFYPALLQVCQSQLQSPGLTRTTDMSLQLLQMLTAHAPTPEALRQTVEVVAPLFRLWATNFDPWSARSAFQYPVPPMLGIFGSWHARHARDFATQAQVLLPGCTARAATVLAASCKHARPVGLRTAILAAALALAETEGADDAFLRELIQSCNDVVLATQRTDISSKLTQTLQAMKSSLSAKLPVAARSHSELQYCLVPMEFRNNLLKEDGSLDDTAVVRWFFSHLAAWLKQLSSRGLDPQVVVAAASEQVREALRSSGL